MTRGGRASRIPGEAGIWVLVLGDMTVFALFFATFMYSRHVNRDQFAHDHDSLVVPLGTANTLLLLTSSLLVALGVTRVMGGRHLEAPKLFLGGLGCGLGFIAVKAVEWGHLFLGGKRAGSAALSSYYSTLTGTHLAHAVVGLVLLARLIALSRRPALSEAHGRFCETGGIFWHMVDLLWIVLFALFYVVR